MARFLRTALVVTFALAVGWAQTGPEGPAAEKQPISAAEYLRSLPKPVFRAGHTLPPLTRYGWTLPFEARVELAESWGYALEFGGYANAAKIAKDLADPKSETARLIALAASDPKRYRLSVIVPRDLPTDVPPGTWTRNADGKFLDGKAQSLDGTVWDPKMKTVYSPASPEEVWRKAGEIRAEPLKLIRSRCPIAVVLNGGEYGVNVLGFAQKVWEQDPRIVKARGETPWFEYLSRQKARFEQLIAEPIRQAVPDRALYIYYTCGGGTHRNVIANWRDWCYGWEWMKGVSDLPSDEAYYRHFNSGWTGKQDMLTLALNAAAHEIASGSPLSYNWLCAGWPRPELKDGGDMADLARYSGFLKCYYTAGMVGGNAGYYAYPKGGFALPFARDDPPHWLRQMAAFAHVHALFSHLEEFLRDGDLLEGPNKHRISPELPAFELPSGDEGVRVLARRHRKRAEWLVTAWAAAGEERSVNVTVPGLGKPKLQARPAGNIYRAAVKDGKPAAELVDKDPMLPTAAMGEAAPAGPRGAAGPAGPTTAPATAAGVIENGKVWRDTAGKEIWSNGGHMIRQDGTFYWVGYQTAPGKPWSIKLYSSTNLADWTFVNEIIPKEGPFAVLGWAGRPGLLHCRKTGNYVVIFEADCRQWNRHKVGFAKCSTIGGKYELAGWQYLEGGRSTGDQSVYQEGDDAYLLCTMDKDIGGRKYVNQSLAIFRLTEDHLGVKQKVFEGFDDVNGNPAVIPRNQSSREASHIAKVGGVYYWFSSGLEGWNSTATKYATAKSLGGPWSELKVLATDPPSRDSYNTQHDFVIPVAGRETTTYLYVGDRYSQWTKKGTGRNIFLPLVWTDGVPTLKWLERWKIDAATGRYQAVP